MNRQIRLAWLCDTGGKPGQAPLATSAVTSASAGDTGGLTGGDREKLEFRPQPVRYPPVTCRCPVKGHSYTGTGRAASVSVACSPGVSGGPAVPWPRAAGLAGREAHRSVHAHVSRQYQRRSGQALPPSATIWPAGKRMPHIQQDLALACSAQYATERSWPVTACSPGRLSARAVVPARGAGTFTGAAGHQTAGAPARQPGQPAVHLAGR
jgi:hypothetical protein